MLSDHASVAIAQIIFYAPIVPLTLYILVKNWPIGPGASRVPWVTLAVLALMRLVGGALVIAGEFDPYNLRLLIAIVVLLNVGLVPLIISTIGMIAIALSSQSNKVKAMDKTMIVIRFLFVTALCLLIVGAAVSLEGNATGDSLVQASYIIFTAIILIIVAMAFYLRSQKDKLAPASSIYILGAAVALPFLVLRILYAVFSSFLAARTWSPVFGSALAFALMALLPEYVTIVVYTYLGFHRIRENAVCSMEVAGSGDDQPQAASQMKDVV